MAYQYGQTPYQYGQTLIITLTFTDLISGDPFDPVAVELIVTDPSGIVTVYTESDMAHPDVGVYEYALVLDQEGYWYWVGGGTDAFGNTSYCDPAQACAAAPLIPVSA